MTDQPAFDAAPAHKYFAAHCFNTAWTYIEKPDRTPADNEQMIRLVHASIWHWTNRPDCTDRNLSIGYWQASRIYVLVGEADNARKYAQLCLDITPTDDSFCLGYANEAMARAELLAGNEGKAKQHVEKAQHHAETVTDKQDQELLINDLKSLQ